MEYRLDNFKLLNRYLYYKSLADSCGITLKDTLEALSSDDFHTALEAVKKRKAKRVAAATRLVKYIERKASGGIKEK